jgi:hypothetical protein
MRRALPSEGPPGASRAASEGQSVFRKGKEYRRGKVHPIASLARSHGELSMAKIARAQIVPPSQLSIIESAESEPLKG